MTTVFAVLLILVGMWATAVLCGWVVTDSLKKGAKQGTLGLAALLGAVLLIVIPALLMWEGITLLDK